MSFKKPVSRIPLVQQRGTLRRQEERPDYDFLENDLNAIFNGTETDWGYETSGQQQRQQQHQQQAQIDESGYRTTYPTGQIYNAVLPQTEDFSDEIAVLLDGPEDPPLSTIDLSHIAVDQQRPVTTHEKRRTTIPHKVMKTSPTTARVTGGKDLNNYTREYVDDDGRRSEDGASHCSGDRVESPVAGRRVVGSSPDRRRPTKEDRPKKEKRPKTKRRRSVSPPTSAVEGKRYRVPSDEADRSSVVTKAYRPPSRTSLRGEDGLTLPTSPYPDTNVLFTSIMNDKQKAASSAVPSVASTAVSKKSLRKPRPTRINPDYALDDLLAMLEGGLRNNAVAKATVKLIYINTRIMPSKDKALRLRLAVTSIYQPERVLRGTVIDETPFLFYSGTAKTDGTSDFNGVLHFALFTKWDKAKGSLDTVFRGALRELAEEMCVDDKTGELTVDGDKLVTATHLELELMSKIHRHYKLQHGADILKFLHCYENMAHLRKSTGGQQACKKYLRMVMYRHNLMSETDLKKALSNHRWAPANMEVWTLVNAQGETNSRIVAHLKSLSEQSESRKVTNDDGWLTRPIADRALWFMREYKTAMETVMEKHEDFLKTMARTSQLMLWLCFGITSPDPKTGSFLMGLFYMLARGVADPNDAPESVCWNYPLMSIIKNQHSRDSEIAEPLLPGMEDVDLDYNSPDAGVRGGPSSAPVYGGGGARIDMGR